ncbi:hypothetical protein N7512_010094 [Penicillium capsulatum]|nr:hypothetical protein N7512_010094 [Penicillium capsulatum]
MGNPPKHLSLRHWTSVFSVARYRYLAAGFVITTFLLFGFYSQGTSVRVIHDDTPVDSPDYWTWETTSSFQDKNDDADHTSNDEMCDNFPTDLLPRIQVTLKTGATEPRDRVDTHLATVTRCISNLLVVSDRATKLHGHHVHDVLADLPLSARNQIPDFEAYNELQKTDGKVEGAMGWKLDRFKFLPMVEYAKKMNPDAEWYVFLETDTYMAWDNLFRFLDQFDPAFPLYMGSPSPGAGLEDGGRVWFAYGGAGFVLSRGAMNKLTDRKADLQGLFTQPSISQEYMMHAAGDCCGDSALGFALYNKGVLLSGLWPMFNAHALHGIPFDEKHWCQPAISMHKTSLADMKGLAKWESQRNRTYPMLYRELAQYLKLGTLPEKSEWDNGDWGAHEAPPDSPVHTSLEACRTGCHESDSCMSYTFDIVKRCIFVPSMRLGGPKKVPGTKLIAGWDNAKFQAWQASHQCENPMWVKPSITRIF